MLSSFNNMFVRHINCNLITIKKALQPEGLHDRNELSKNNNDLLKKYHYVCERHWTDGFNNTLNIFHPKLMISQHLTNQRTSLGIKNLLLNLIFSLEYLVSKDCSKWKCQMPTHLMHTVDLNASDGISILFSQNLQN